MRTLIPPVLQVPQTVFSHLHPHPPTPTLLLNHTPTLFSPPPPPPPPLIINYSTQELFPKKKKRSSIVVFGKKKEGLLFDEDDDMEGYLNSLSLEYDSVWDTKPSWCQPWTITLTGISIIGISWLVLHSLVVTSLISLLIGAWWYIFLYSYPKAYSEIIAERREKVTNGVEDTFGVRKKQ